jgi:F-type H+-transporting ATPase subunit gamma
MKFQGLQPSNKYTHFEDKPTFDEVDELAQRYIGDFVAGKIDRLEVVYTRFETVSRQVAVCETLLPIGKLDEDESDTTGGTATEYEFAPSAKDILEEIVPAAFKARLFKCFLDAAVSEQISRMVAMKGATENATDMISTLSMKYNRARQSQITSELSEIIGGTAALE